MVSRRFAKKVFPIRVAPQSVSAPGWVTGMTVGFGAPGTLNRGEMKRFAGVVRDQHLEEVLVRVAEAEEGHTESVCHLVDDRIRKLEAVLRMRRVRVGRRNKNRLRGPGHTAICGTAKA